MRARLAQRTIGAMLTLADAPLSGDEWVALAAFVLAAGVWLWQGERVSAREKRIRQLEARNDELRAELEEERGVRAG